MSSSGDKQVDKSTSVTNSLLPDSSSCSGASSSSCSNGTRWNKTQVGYGSYKAPLMTRRHLNSNHDDLSSLSQSSSNEEEEDESLYHGRNGGGDGFEVDLLSSEPEDFDESGHLFHMDIMKQSLSDISLPVSTRQRIHCHSAKLPKSSQNLSFSRDRVREIERHNQILLQKIMTSKPTLKTKPRSSRAVVVNTPVASNSRITSAAVNRRKKQRQIEINNQLLRKKLEKIERSRRTVL